MNRIMFFMARAGYWPHGGPDSKNATRGEISAAAAGSLQDSRACYRGHE